MTGASTRREPSHLAAAFLLPGAACALLAAGVVGGSGGGPGPAGSGRAEHDVVIRGGTVYDGSGGPPVTADVTIDGDRVTAVGDLPADRGRLEIDAAGLAVAPGFINMLSHSFESLLQDGRGQSDVRQGVTLEVFGEISMGPWTPEMRRDWAMRVHHPVPWSTLGEYFEHLERSGISPNVASFVGAGVVRSHVVGPANREATPAEIDRMRALVRQSMEEGAVGLTCALIYPTCSYSRTDELVALARVVAEHDGMVALHLRSEGIRLLEGVDEILHIARAAGVRAEVYHLKALGESNWSKLGQAIEAVEAARAQGLRVTADIYPYTAGWTGLDASMPGWVQEGGLQEWIKRLRDSEVRERLKREMSTPGDWDNWLLAAGSPERVLLVGFETDSLQPLVGKTLAEVAALWGTSPAEAAMDLVVKEGRRVMAVYFVMSEENVRRVAALPWVSFGSDESAIAPEGSFLERNPHPRAYGTFARVLGTYVRDEGVLPLEEAVRRLTSLPAENLGLRERGRLAPGAFADVVVFDPATIRDHATYESPHRYATGVRHVFVNGVQVLKDGEHTGAKPGRIVRGRGWTGWEAAERRAEPASGRREAEPDCIGLGCGDSVAACVGMGCPE